MFSGSREESRVYHISSSRPVEKRRMVAKVTADYGSTLRRCAIQNDRLATWERRNTILLTCHPKNENKETYHCQSGKITFSFVLSHVRNGM